MSFNKLGLSDELLSALQEKNYLKAYELLEQTVKNYYEHQLAFTYLYLLMIILEKNQQEEPLLQEHES